jgi:stage II sporulation protein R
MDGVFMKLKPWEISLMLAVAAAILVGALAAREQAQLSQKLIRLHVVANSDSEEDQAVKLLVRDDILAAAQPWLAEAADAEEAADILQSHLDDLRDVAQARLDAVSPSEVTVTLLEEVFPQRDYDTFSLPGGTYLSLRVTIGEGTGHNWWCVVFPSLCLAATTEDLTAAATAAGLSDAEIALITAETPEYQLRFKTIDLVQSLLRRLRTA